MKKILFITMIIIILFCNGVLGADNKLNFQIQKKEDVSFSNTIGYVYHVVVKDEPTPSDLRTIGKTVVEKVKLEREFNALSIMMYDYKEYIGNGYTLGKVEYAPYGDWSKADSVSTGNYNKMSYNFDVRDKDWSKQLSPEEVKSWIYFNDLLYSTTLSEEKIAERTAKKFNITQKQAKEIMYKQMTWIYNDKNGE